MRKMRTRPNAEAVEADVKVAVDLSGLRERRRNNPLIGERELYDFQYLVLLAISINSPEASGLTVLDFIVREAGIAPDHAQTYGAISRLIGHDFVEQRERVNSQNRGPKVRLLAITERGEDALARKNAQIQALNELRQKYGSTRTRKGAS